MQKTKSFSAIPPLPIRIPAVALLTSIFRYLLITGHAQLMPCNPIPCPNFGLKDQNPFSLVCHPSNPGPFFCISAACDGLMHHCPGGTTSWAAQLDLTVPMKIGDTFYNKTLSSSFLHTFLSLPAIHSCEKDQGSMFFLNADSSSNHFTNTYFQIKITPPHLPTSVLFHSPCPSVRGRFCGCIPPRRPESFEMSKP